MNESTGQVWRQSEGAVVPESWYIQVHILVVKCVHHHLLDDDLEISHIYHHPCHFINWPTYCHLHWWMRKNLENPLDI